MIKIFEKATALAYALVLAVPVFAGTGAEGFGLNRQGSVVSALAEAEDLSVSPVGNGGAGSTGYLPPDLREEFLGKFLRKCGSPVDCDRDAARRVERQVAKVIKDSMPSVVLIQYGYSLGSGFLVDPRGYVVTNFHVIEGGVDGGGNVTVRTLDGASIPGSVKAVDAGRDLALVKLEYPRKNWPVLSLGKTENVVPGNFSIALGHPYGVPHSASFGIISAVNRRLRRSSAIFVQTDACINPGNSGGPLMDLDGRVVGVNTALISNAGGCDGVGFAVSSQDVRDFLNLVLPSATSDGPDLVAIVRKGVSMDPELPKEAPDFTLKDYNEEDVTLSQFKGKVVLLDFWAGWCSPCLTPLPKINELRAEFSGGVFEVLGIGTLENDPQAVERLAKKYGVEFPLLLDTAGDVSRAYGISSIPRFILIDHEGYIKWDKTGFSDGDEVEFRARIKELIDARPEGPAKTARALEP